MDDVRLVKRFRRAALGALLLSLLGGLAATALVAQDKNAKPRHWAFVPPVRPVPPSWKSDDSDESRQLAAWLRNPIDAFVLARFQREGLEPAPQADKQTLIRRVTLDLTGLPPTLAEIDAFLADDTPDAYERLVDRLLKSPRYGERMAVPWLYAARYADTSGYQNDGPRHMWRWRDWVIDAFNSNMPFDQFAVEQIAGDTLPGATLEQKIATGFNRNHRGNAEGGIIPEEYAVEYVVDRVETTATVFMGLTLGCARCHDHKFDPFTQKEFYAFYAYFNNIAEFGRAIKEGNSPPYVEAPTREDEAELRRLEARLAAAERRLASMQPQLAAAQADWERSFAARELIQWSITDGLVASYPLDGSTADARGKLDEAKFQDGDAAFIAGPHKPDASVRDGNRQQNRGAAALREFAGLAADFDGRRFIDTGDVANFGYFDRFSLAAWVLPRGEHGGTIISRMTDADQADGYSVRLKDGKVQVNLVKRWLDDAVRVETERGLPQGRWSHVTVTYDGSRRAAGIAVYVNGRPEKLAVELDFINQSFAVKQPLRIGGGGGPDGRFRGAISDVRAFDRCIAADEAEVVATIDSIGDIVRAPAERRSTAQTNKLAAYFLNNVAPESIRQAHRDAVAARRQREKFVEDIPTVMVMEEMPTRRETFLLVRGVYDRPGEKVSPGVPANLAPLPAGAPNNRLGLARWLVDPANPLTARVAVNRFWQMVFGTGLVKTPEDFGLQGDPPSHPELLDWLATEFIRTGWDVKGLQKLIVTSATYRQSSRATPILLAKDPDNRLLARGPRLRLSAETVRDQALAVSGLLAEKLGGPSVKPYQPAGLWKEIATDGDYAQDHGPNLYRRSLYTYWKRTVAPPSMVAFDATARETCTVRETRTNTPLQALTLMNEVTFVEAARVLAERMMTEGGPTPDERIAFAFRLATARRPRPQELQVLVRGFEQHLARFTTDHDAAAKLVSTGERPLASDLNLSELAACSTIASLILNLDEVVTKQ